MRTSGCVRDCLGHRRLVAGTIRTDFVTLAKELQAWRFLLGGRFEGVRGEVDGMVDEWFALEEG